MKYKRVKISDVYEGLYDGPHATPPNSDEGAIFLGISNITKNGHIDFTNIKYINENDLPKWTRRVTPKAGDIVFSYEATLNLYAIIPEGFWGCLGRRMALIRPDETKVNGKYLYYYFFSEEWRATIAENTIVGATVDRIPIAKFPEFPISLPPLETQCRIANILSMYDDLLENNRKQINLLEEAVQRLYKEWFVDLRFPGYEAVEVIDGIPKGWRKTSIGEYLTVKSGYAFKSEWWRNSGYPVVKIKDIVNNTINTSNLDYVAPEYTSQISEFKLNQGDVVIAMTGATIGKVGLVPDSRNLYTNQRVGKVFPSKEIINPTAFVFCFYTQQSILEQIVALSSSSSAQPNISGGQLESFEIVASLEMINSFCKIAKVYFDKINNLRKQNELLLEARNRLLPKLMSGEIEV